MRAIYVTKSVPRSVQNRLLLNFIIQNLILQNQKLRYNLFFKKELTNGLIICDLTYMISHSFQRYIYRKILYYLLLISCCITPSR